VPRVVRTSDEYVDRQGRALADLDVPACSCLVAAHDSDHLHVAMEVIVSTSNGTFTSNYFPE
jgi:hypothetical protein